MSTAQASNAARILVVGDTHIGLARPSQPAVGQRGRDFLANLERALAPALAGSADIVVHTGDLFDQLNAPAEQIEIALILLRAVADRGIPMFIVPGNHEHGQVPLQHWIGHPGIRIFDQPRTFVCQAGETRVALAGFPYAPEARAQFPQLVAATAYQDVQADIHLLCIHQTVEGARVGPSEFMYRSGRDVIRGSHIPGNVAAVVAGHIHRYQMLTRMLNGAPLAAPVIYAGAVERTSFTERDETKAYAQVTLDAHERSVQVQFVPLPTRPMIELRLDTDLHQDGDLIAMLQANLEQMPQGAVVQVRLHGSRAEEALNKLAVDQLREIAPEPMHVTVAVPRARARPAIVASVDPSSGVEPT